MKKNVLKLTIAGAVMVVLAITIIFASGPSHAQDAENKADVAQEMVQGDAEANAECMRVCEDAGYTKAEIEAYCAEKNGECKKTCSPADCK